MQRTGSAASKGLVLLLVLLFSVIGKRPERGWTANELIPFLDQLTGGSTVIDPERILSPGVQQQIAETIKHTPGIKIVFVLLSKINPEYWDYTKNQVDSLGFIRDIKVLSGNSGLNLDDHLIILYSLIDELDHWFISRKALKTISKEVCDDFAADTRRSLRVHDTDRVFLELFKSIKDSIDYANKIDKIIQMVYLTIIMGLIFVYLNKERKDHLLNTRIAAIKRYESSGQQLHKYAAQNCIVCHDGLYSVVDISQVAKQKPKAINPVFLDETVKEKKIDESQIEASQPHILEPGIVTLDRCDHKFHPECLHTFFDQGSYSCLICEPVSQSSSSKHADRNLLLEVQYRSLKNWYSPSQIKFYFRQGKLPSLADYMFGRRGSIIPRLL